MSVLSAPRRSRRSDVSPVMAGVLYGLIIEAVLAAVAFGVYELLTKVWP